MQKAIRALIPSWFECYVWLNFGHSPVTGVTSYFGLGNLVTKDTESHSTSSQHMASMPFHQAELPCNGITSAPAFSLSK